MLCFLFACAFTLAFDAERFVHWLDSEPLLFAASTRSAVDRFSCAPKQFIHFLIKGAMGGRLVVMTATNVSRTSHIPSPFAQGSYRASHVSVCIISTSKYERLSLTLMI